jgi:DNA-3-methyladenine glycosylase
MFLGGGHAYVYFIYGMYYCFNVVTGPEGSGQAVLIRAIEPLEGVETMLRRRGRESLRGLADGPGKLAIALGIGPDLDGADLVKSPRVWIEEGEPIPHDKVLITPRIGITKAAELPWRWMVA